jgi:hypothetical protein
VVVEEIVNWADLWVASTFTGYVVEVLTCWATLNHARTIADFLVPEVITGAADFKERASAGVLVEIHWLRNL